jgi:hypothetical protein
MITTHTIHIQLLENIALAIAHERDAAKAHENSEEALDHAIQLGYHHGLTPEDIESFIDANDLATNYGISSNLVALHKPKARKGWLEKQQQPISE